MTNGRRKILAIDDSPVVLRNLKLLLKDEYDVILATGGEMGIKRALEEQPDIILLDYEMPEMDGNETFEQLSEYEETMLIPVVFLTSVHDEKRVREVMKLCPAAYVLKPIESDVLRNELKKVIKKWNI